MDRVNEIIPTWKSCQCMTNSFRAGKSKFRKPGEVSRRFWAKLGNFVFFKLRLSFTQGTILRVGEGVGIEKTNWASFVKLRTFSL